jgi:hypothetical protein
MPEPKCPTNNPDQTKLVWASSPNRERRFDRLMVYPDTISLFAKLGQWNTIGQYFGLVHGNVRGMHTEEKTTGLLDPVAIFQGLERPVDDRSGQDFYVFVTNPNRSYRYLLKERSMSGELVWVRAPTASVFVTYVDYDPKIVADVLRECGYATQEEIKGIIYRWRWEFASSQEPHLPDGYSNRFARQVF